LFGELVAEMPKSFIKVGAVNIALIKASQVLPGVIYYNISTEYLQYLIIYIPIYIGIISQLFRHANVRMLTI
jgi:hypothetical protein